FIDVGTMALTAVPYAIHAKQLERHSVDSLLRVEDGGLPQSATALTSENFSELMALIGGTSTQYLKQSSGGGAVLPGYSGTPTSLVEGSIWFDLQAGELKYYDVMAVKVVGSGGGGGSGTVTSITAGAGLTGGTITTSGTIALEDH